MKKLRSAIILCGGKGTRLEQYQKKFQNPYQNTSKRSFVVYY